MFERCLKIKRKTNIGVLVYQITYYKFPFCGQYNLTRSRVEIDKNDVYRWDYYQQFNSFLSMKYWVTKETDNNLKHILWRQYKETLKLEFFV